MVAAATRPGFGIGSALNRWRYAEGGRRDARLDLLRGYAVFAMICDHVTNISWFSPFTGGNRFVASAAEGFVFLAGLVIGMVYGGRIRRDGWMHAVEAILHRAVTLYLVTVGLTLLFVGLFELTSLRLWLDREYGLGLTDPVELLVDTLTLRYTYHGTDILWMYTVLIAASPLVFLLLCHRQTGPALALSWGIWLAYRMLPDRSIVPFVATNVTYFPPAAWQLLFVNGMVVGYHREAIGRALGRVPARVYLVVFGTGLAGLVAMHRAYDTGRLAGWPILGSLAGEAYLIVFDKTTVPPGRILAFFVVAGFCYSLVTVLWSPIKGALGWLLLPLGTYSLRAYSIHLVLIVVIYNIDVLARLYDRSRTANTIMQALAVGLTYLAIVAWQRIEQGVGWEPSLPEWAPRLRHQHPILLGAVSALVLGVTVGGLVVAGPVRTNRQTTIAEATVEADVLRYVPRAAADGGPLTLLLALHGDDQTGPEFAAPLVDVARSNGWALIAPTIAYGDRSDPDQIAGVIATILPVTTTLIENFGAETGVSLRSRVLIYGGGRGANTARLFGLFYPKLVAAVAASGGAPCMVPATELEGASLPVPFGLADLDRYTGEPFDPEALRRVAFWNGIAPSRGESTPNCRWGALIGRAPAERAQLFADLLTGIGAEVQVVDADRLAADEPLEAQALAFLRGHEPGPEE